MKSSALSKWRVPAFGFGLLAAGWAWTAANFWRATMDRFWANDAGLPLQFGDSRLHLTF